MVHFFGDLRTLVPPLRHRLRPRRARAAARAWSTALEDPGVGPLRLTGALREVPGARELVLLVHGLGGSPDSYYCEAGAVACERAGVSSLALSLRGSDRRGEDFYNIALTADLHAAVQSPELARYDALYVVGYSMGGYVTLHYACEADPRVRAVAAVCTPVGLRAAQLYIDRARAWAYRTHVLRGLVSIYLAVAARRPVPTPAEEVRRVRTMYDWDRLTIAPRYGYDSPEHYYEELDVGRRLEGLGVPALLVACEDDPVVPPSTIRPFLPAGAPVETRWLRRGGHLAFGRGLDLGCGPERGLDAQILSWLRSRAGAPLRG